MRRILLLALLLMLALPLSVHAFVLEKSRTGATLHWNESSIPVPWHMNTGGAPELGQEISQQTLHASFQTWEDVECSYLAFEYKGLVNLTPNQVGTRDYDRQNVMIWIEQEDWPGEWVDAFAVTVPLFEEQTGRLVDVDILFNRKFRWSVAREGESGKADLQSIATHEIGHLFGLDHPPVPDATMFWSAVEGETHKRTLAADDIQGICHIYPVKGKTGFPCSSPNHCEGERVCQEHLASGGYICSQACVCDWDCSPAFSCIDGQCLPPKPEIGEFAFPCGTTRPCGHDDLICVSGLCTIYCSSVADCPDGWDCLKLMGHAGSACYTSNPSLLPQNAPTHAASILEFDATPANALPRTNITLRCEAQAPADSEAEMRYRFSVRSVGAEWEILKDFSRVNVSYWTPTAPGAYELRVEVMMAGEGLCPDDERIITYTIHNPDEPPGDGTEPDEDKSGSGGGCRQNPPVAGFGLMLLALALVHFLRRRA